METKAAAPTTIDEYIALFPPETQDVLQTLRAGLHKVAPDATERISWQMPTFYLYGNMIHFAAQKHHLGLYPGANGIAHFLPRLAAYKTSKGAVQFPYSKPIPYELIYEIAAFCRDENLQEAKEKGTI